MIKYSLIHIKPKEQTSIEKTIAKWEASGLLDGLHKMEYRPNLLPFINDYLVPVQPMSAPNPDAYFYIKPIISAEHINITNNENT